MAARQTAIGRLRVDVAGLGTVREVHEFLESIETAYAGLLVIRLYRRDSGPRKRPTQHRVSSSTASDLLFPSELLRVSAARFQSPGFWEFVGSLNPLETIRRYLDDRHRRKLELEDRTLEIERKEIEIATLKLDLIREQTDYLRTIGVDEAEIRELANRWVLAPLSRLDSLQDSHQIQGVSAEALEPSRRRRGRAPESSSPASSPRD